MNINQTLLQYQQASGLTGVAIAHELGLKPRLIHAWLNDENQPVRLNLLLLQEFLKEKGCTVSTPTFSECILYIRHALYKKRVTIQGISEGLGIAERYLLDALCTGRLPSKYKAKCIAYVSQLQTLEGDSLTVDELAERLVSLSGPLKTFVERSTLQERATLRAKVSVFILSNLMGRLCSETAFRNHK